MEGIVYIVALLYSIAIQNFCFYCSRFHLISLDKTLADNLKGTVIVEHPIFQVVLDPADEYPLIGTPVRVREPKAKVERIAGATNSSGDNNEQDGPDGKKQKLTFFDVSDGEEHSESWEYLRRA